MRYFWIRLFIFTGIWSLMIDPYGNEKKWSVSLLLLAASLVCLFFLSKEKPSLYLFLSLSALVMIHGLFIGDQAYTVLLLLFVLIFGSLKLPKNSFVLLLILLVGYTVVSVWRSDSFLLFWLLLLGACTYLLMELADKKSKEAGKNVLYENLLSEYRQLKRMHTSQEEIAKAEERTRIAREIHDSVGHRLTDLIMRIELLHLETRQDALIELKALANDSLEETRAAVKTLEETEAHGLAAIVQLIRKLEAESQLMISFTMKEGVLSIELTNEQGITLYRVMQEALTNVMRHSDSKMVWIEMSKAPIEGIYFSIKNPYTKTISYEEGFGIRHMRQRVENMHGKLDIYQTEKHFTVEGLLPLVKEDEGLVALDDR